MSCWEVLGLNADADTRSIKRRYAVLLKQHRPDEDPTGFQRLREAYEHALQWSRSDAPAHMQRPGQIETVQPATAAPDTRHEHATALVADATPQDLQRRYQQARDADCAEAFEALLLERCLTQAEPSITQWAITHLHWLSPWQRDVPVRLSEHRLNALLSRMFTDLGRSLTQLLEQQQVDAFNSLLIELNQTEWLKPIERHERLNALLASSLLASSFWSETLFETLCAQQNWSPKFQENRCPEPQWSHLQARNALEHFAAHIRHAATLDSRESPHRAARLLFGEMTLEERKRFARRFGESDWHACRTLSENLIQHYPALCAEMPGGDPYFWRDWERVSRPWPMFVALLGMAAGWALHDQLSTDHSLMDTLGQALSWTLLIATPALLILAIWLPATDDYGKIDERLTLRLAPWLSFRRPAPLVIREIAPCWLLGLLIWMILGSFALIGYMAALHTLGLAQRVLGRPAVRLALETHLSPKRLKIFGLGVVVLMVLAAQTHHDNWPVERDEGLQPFMMSACSGLKTGCLP
ncbi:J domain-containing protein [Pseudomonas costantinii]|uniref:J domain-containing protein n=1 Tax=Pseudomonas costantinii TaxID=168469 RepID=A0A1S2UIE5_9PSED|nr:J domain-containing protein [Pseudomonas costantinii]NVZ21511.1 J domain-containing protein [Pseudomonas costantinii]OIN45940.1 hypothetical protein BFL40_27260 [Pseudomonas costantinii]SEE54850.1 hypothetical protein SAMN04515675_6177 [Pseudomonas costantinii]